VPDNSDYPPVLVGPHELFVIHDFAFLLRVVWYGITEQLKCKGGCEVRIAAFVLGLVASLILFGETVLVSCAGSVAEAFEAPEAESLNEGAGAGFIAFFLGIIGSALAFRHGIASGILLLLAFLICLVGGLTTHFGDLTIWGFVFLLSGIFAFVGAKKKVAKSSENDIRDVQ